VQASKPDGAGQARAAAFVSAGLLRQNAASACERREIDKGGAMMWHWTSAGVAMLGGAALYAALVGYVWRRRRSSAGSSLVLTLLAAGLWTLAYAFELAAATLPAKQFWGDLKYLGICLLPPAWFAFAASFSGRGHWVNRRSLALLAVEPLAVLALLANRATHDLIRFYPPGGGGRDAVARSGPLFWPHLVYTDVVLWGSLGLFVLALMRASRVYRRPSLILIGTLLVPLAANLLYVFGVGPLGRVDLSPFGFLAAGLVVVWGLFRFRLLGIVPVARSLVFETITDAVVVLDPLRRVVNLNPAAERLLGVCAVDGIGRAVEELLPALRALPAWPPRPDAAAAPLRVTLGDGGAARWWELRVSPIPDRRGGQAGWLLVLRDVTSQHLGMERLRRMDEQRRYLLRRLVSAQEEERRQVAGDIHDDLIQAMAAVSLHLQVLRLQLPDPRHRERLEQLEGAVGGSVQRLRELIFDLRPPVLDEVGLAAALEQYARHLADLGGFTVEVRDRLAEEPPPELRVIAYRIAQEALANVRRHAAARSVHVDLEQADGGMRFTVTDDGVGFEPDVVDAEPRPGHIGMTSMRERAAMAGGRTRVHSRPGRGTTVEVWLPLKE
jgi:signal transduction histidine kinase